jgi:hypothetical protein
MVVSFLVMAGFGIHSCKHDGVALGTDLLLYDMATVDTGFVWFKFSDAALDKSSGSGHSEPKLRTRYNAMAATMLDSEGRIQEGIQFPEGSLIVKELLDNDLSISLYAVLYKSSGNADADENGWVWGYLNPNGTVRTPASQKGSGCIGCHTQSGHIDYMLMNKFYP